MSGTEAPVAVVTGANSGIGRAVAIHLAAQGQTVYGTVRSLDKAVKLNGMAAGAGVDVHLVELDVADDASVQAGLARVLDEAGRVDVLVNNAGVGGNGVVEETTIESYAEVMNVNLYGALRCLKAVLPGMRERRRGTIVNVTSVVGRFAALAQAPYVASKWALEGASEELAQELAAFGIRVAIVEPGITKSAIFAKNQDAAGEGSPYGPHLRRMFQFYAAGHPHATDPFEVARVVHGRSPPTPRCCATRVLGRPRDPRPPPADHRRAVGRPRRHPRRRRLLPRLQRHPRRRHHPAGPLEPTGDWALSGRRKTRR